MELKVLKSIFFFPLSCFGLLSQTFWLNSTNPVSSAFILGYAQVLLFLFYLCY